jgi:hypothetical protein
MLLLCVVLVLENVDFCGTKSPLYKNYQIGETLLEL